MLRRKVRSEEVSERAARGHLRGVRSVVTERYPHGPLADAAWDLRGNVTFYDALYVALAARLDLPLLTTDHELTDAPNGLPCAVDYVTT